MCSGSLGSATLRDRILEASEIIRQIAKLCTERSLQVLNPSELDTISQFFEEALDAHRRIAERKATDAKDEQFFYETLILRLDDLRRKAISEIHLLLFPKGSTNESEATFKELRKLMDESEKQEQATKDLEAHKRRMFESSMEFQRALRNELNSSKERIDTVIEQAKLAAAPLSISGQSKHFLDETKKHNTQAVIWLFATVVLIGSAYDLVWHNLLPQFQDFPKNASTQFLIMFAAPKVMLFMILFYSITWLGRNFLVSRHNAVVNQHRAATLNTLPTLLGGVTTLEARESIILQATTCIFAHQPSGFDHNETPVPKPTEILKFTKPSE